MSFASEASSSANYERYVSESDTDGDGNVTNPDRQRRQQPRKSARPIRPGSLGHFGARGETQAKRELLGSCRAGGRRGSVLARLAAGWRTSVMNSGIIQPDDQADYRLYGDGASWHGRQGYIAQGNPSSGLPGRINGGMRDAMAGLPVGSSSTSGLKGLKTSLHDEADGEDDPTAPRDKDSSARYEAHVRGEPRGVWDEAGKGDLATLAAALAPAAGGDVHARMPDGWTALHSAAHAGHAAAIDYLVRSGAPTAARARRGWTPLHTACMRGRYHAARALLAVGADADARAVDQRTPLHFACEAGSPECVKELLKAGASANVSDQDARTPLHFGKLIIIEDQACIDGSTECVRRLLSAGASHLPPDAWGRDPAAVARQLDRTGPLKLLQAAAARCASRGGRAGGSGSGSGSGSGNTSGGSRARSAETPVPIAHEHDGGDEGDGGSEEVTERSGSMPAAEGEHPRDAPVAAAGDSAAAGTVAVSGRRWVVMNEEGRMLERASGRVALFKSMGAAADWANTLVISSGSFQVAEIAPAMREAFEREIMSQITGGGTQSEEEEEDKQDPQWTRFRRQQAAARAERFGAGSGSTRAKRRAWGIAAQRRDEENARLLLQAAKERLQEVIDETEMHREKAVSLERALEAVLRDCETVAAAVTTDAPPACLSSPALNDGAPAETGVAGATVVEPGAESAESLDSSFSPDVHDPPTSESCPGSLISESGVEPERGALPVSAGSGDGSGEGHGVIHLASSAPSLLLGVDEPRARVLPLASEGRESPRDGQQNRSSGDDCGDGSGSRGNSDISESETDAEVDDDVNDDCEEAFGSGCIDRAHSLVTEGDVERARGRRAGGGRGPGPGPGAGIRSHGPPPPLLRFDAPSEKTRSAAGRFEDNGVGDHGCVDDEAQQKRLAAWLATLQIRRPDALRYAESLVADGFDSGEALRGIREDELVQYGMKKGHARLITRTLAEGSTP